MWTVSGPPIGGRRPKKSGGAAARPSEWQAGQPTPETHSSYRPINETFRFITGTDRCFSRSWEVMRPFIHEAKRTVLIKQSNRAANIMLGELLHHPGVTKACQTIYTVTLRVILVNKSSWPNFSSIFPRNLSYLSFLKCAQSSSK